MTSFAAIVLAAGKSTRMRSARPKALHAVAGRPMITHILNALQQAGAERTVVVVGHGADQIRAEVGNRVEFADQTEQRGTGHAALAARELLSGWTGPIVILPGDAPLITPEAIAALLENHVANGATLLTVELERPTGYGRVIRDPAGNVAAIVEEKDATTEQRAIREVNVSIYAFDPAFLFPALDRVQPANTQGEYYLTDVIAMARAENRAVGALAWEDASVGRGVNTRVELAEIDAIFHARLLREHMLNGVTIIDPISVRIESEVKIGADTTIWPFSILRGVTDIGEGCEIGPGARIDDSTIGSGTRVRDSWVVASEIGTETLVGPFANIRPNSTIGNKVKIGDFVEIKASVIKDNVSAGHFAYLGDAEVGSHTNIGAGAITCNYDGYKKHKTTIGERVFVGSNTTLVAPVVLGDDSFIAAGSVINQDVPSQALGVARTRQVNKEGWAATYKRGKEMKPE